MIGALSIIVLMLFFNALFAAYEMALAAVSPTRLSALVENKKSGAKDALYMKDRIEASLAVIQLGITLVGAVAAAAGGAGADEAFAPALQARLGVSQGMADALALALIIIPLSAFTIVFAELVPKTFALNNKEWVCLRLSPAMKWLYRVFYPVVWLFESVVRLITTVGRGKLKEPFGSETTHVHELRAAASMARTSRLIGARQEQIVHSATELSVRPVRDILIPASEISMIPAGLSLSDALIKAHLDMHTRFPVCEKRGDVQTIVGYVNFKDIIFALHANPADPTLEGITRPIKSVDANVKNSVVLEEMIQSGAHIALVRDGGKVIGMVTLEDILEELVGEIQDEYDRLPGYVHPYLSGWIIGGGALMTVVASTVGMRKPYADGPLDKVPTLAEWCRSLKKNGALVSGEVLLFDDLTITVRKLRRKQLAEAMVLKTQTP